MINRKLTYQNFYLSKEVSLKKGIGVEKKCCRYTYDALNRITSAIDNTGHYNLTSVSYDKNGNIQSLNRKGDINTSATLFGNMDLLKYYYQPNSNKLKKVLDTSGKIQGFKDGANVATEYTYDANGNMISDANKGITSISYNYLNMPTEIKFNNSNTKKINYIYAADSIKVRKIVNDNGNITTTDYAGNFVYENNTLKQFYHPEGYVEPSGSNYLYVYQYKDHLNNVRLTYADTDGNSTIAQSEIKREQNYYPYGMEHKGYNNTIVGAKNNLKTYQGQEFTEDLGVNVFEFKYRMHDPVIGRFWQIDPLAEKYVHNGTYNFSENRVIDSRELEGLERVYSADGKFINQVGDSNEILVMKHNEGNGQALIDTANNPNLTDEERSQAINVLRTNSFHGFDSTDDAASSFAFSYNQQSIDANVELGAVINKVELSDANGESIGSTFILGDVVSGNGGEVDTEKMIEQANIVVDGFSGKSLSVKMPGDLAAFTHTHANRSLNFSTGGGGIISSDETVSKYYKVPIYMSNSKGEVKKGNFHLGESPKVINKYPVRPWYLGR